MTETPKEPEYLLTAKGLAELDKYFIEHKDSLIKIAWYNLKDTAIRPLPEHDRQVRESVLDETLDKIEACIDETLNTVSRWELEKTIRLLRPPLVIKC